MRYRTLHFHLVDVFAETPLSGNSLSVFLLDADLPVRAMQRITQEMRQFESIFVCRIGFSNRFITRIFTMEEELEFAGHPIIGAAAVLHAEFWSEFLATEIEFEIAGRSIAVRGERQGDAIWAEMDQGRATTPLSIASTYRERILRALNLSVDDAAAGLEMQVISTGLPYLIVPVQSNLHQARIVVADFEELLQQLGAKFVYVLDVTQCEGRTWDNAGLVEDIATGSAAGPAAVYLVSHGLAPRDTSIALHQGRYVGRPSVLHACVRGADELQVSVRGQVCRLGQGVLSLPESVLSEVA